MGAFEGKVVWVTGGGTGIGRALALEFAREGARVAVSGRREGRLREVVGTLGPSGLAVPCDVTDESSCEAAVAAVLERFGQLDVVVANAGFGVIGAIAKLTDAQWRQQFDVNVFGLLNTVRTSLPSLEETGGRVVLMASVSSFFHTRRGGPYNASKAAVWAIGDTLSAELSGSKVSCSTIFPGFVESEIGQVDNEGVYHPDKRDKRPQMVMWKSDRAARVIVRAVAKRKRAYVFTGHGRFAVFLARHFPGLTAMLAART